MSNTITFELRIEWSISEKPGYEGQNVAELYVDNHLHDSVMGGNYDMEMALIGEWLNYFPTVLGRAYPRKVMYLTYSKEGDEIVGRFNPAGVTEFERLLSAIGGSYTKNNVDEDITEYTVTLPK